MPLQHRTEIIFKFIQFNLKSTHISHSRLHLRICHQHICPRTHGIWQQSRTLAAHTFHSPMSPELRLSYAQNRVHAPASNPRYAAASLGISQRTDAWDSFIGGIRATRYLWIASMCGCCNCLFMGSYSVGRCVWWVKVRLWALVVSGNVAGWRWRKWTYSFTRYIHCRWA